MSKQDTGSQSAIPAQPAPGPQSPSTDADARARLQALIQRSGQGYAEISRLIGRNAAYVQQYIKRGVPRRLAEADRRQLANHFGVPESALGGPESPAHSISPDATLHQSHEIPFLDGPARTLTIDGAFVARLRPAFGQLLAAHRVEGDGMAPTLLAGDHLLIDLEDRSPARDGVYVIEGESAPLVKRLSVNPISHRIAILSDNAAYPSFPDCDPADIRLLGRVIWVGRALP
jgi:hypothetical protein